jgi:hypothetical protein
MRCETPKFDRLTKSSARPTPNNLEAPSIVLREYLFEVLADRNGKHVTGVPQALYDFLLTGIGRRAHKTMKNDPAGPLAAFQDDARLDKRWREKSLASMRRTIDRRRTAWGAFAA